MNFNRHSNLEGQHAFLGASKYHWINYSEDKVAEAYSKFLATQKGTVLHDFAARCISLGQKLPKSQKTLNMYVNDAIGYKMTPEQVLYYSENCFGTADAISFRNGLLRIHDLRKRNAVWLRNIKRMAGCFFTVANCTGEHWQRQNRRL